MKSRIVPKVEIAGVSFGVSIDSVLWQRYCRRDYEPFTTMKPPEYAIEVREDSRSGCSDSSKEGLSIPRLSVRGGIYYFQSTVYPKQTLASIDPAAQRACLICYNEGGAQMYLRTLLRIVIQLFLLKERACIIHACGAVRDRQGYLFPGSSGSGKTTLAGLLSSYTILSDEFICIRENKNGYHMYSTPWRGKNERGYPLKGVIVPKKARNLRLRRISSAQGCKRLFENIIFPFVDENILLQALFLVQNSTVNLPMYDLYFGLDSPVNEVDFS